MMKLRKNRVSSSKQAPPVPVRSAIKDVGAGKKETKAPEGPKTTIRDFFGV
jgi:hypothetical protein